ncbi:MAG TPA: SpaA isopeptide-forming pilin-related protein [Propionibacteriaceae bacterium]|nr:SpaA isopeptide-forming pilin-related protein [Propionibacteriaceae bacterium]
MNTTFLPHWRTILSLILTAVFAVSATGSALASHPEVSLPGSNFEIDTNANLRLDDPSPSIDWASVTESRRADQPQGSQDDSFGQGTKEDTAVPTIVNGSIPPNKSDLLTFGAYLERTTSGARFLNLFWHRIQEPSGTTNMDFEFNQSSSISGNGVTPVRSAGDLLIQYDLSQGGTNPVLFVSRWVTSGPASQCQASNSVPCWGTKINLSAAGDAAGSINTSAIPAAESDGLGNISPRTFGEAQLDFDALTGGGSTCVSFGSVYLKSRSSDSFSAALKDFIAPVSTNVTNCGTVNIHKQDDLGAPLAGAVFTLYTDNAPVDGAPPHGAEDVATSLTCTTDAAGDCSIGSVPFGDYWAVETTGVPNHDLAPDQSFSLTESTPDLTISLTFVDPRRTGAILVTKTRKHAASGSGDHPHSGVSFTVDGVTQQTDANGEACFDGLAFGDYTVHETVPAGYHVDANDKSVTVDNAASCSDATYTGETVSFQNMPLTNLTVSVDSQVDGGTSSTIDCVVASGSTGANGDGSVTASDLEPGTYTCTVVIDP